MGFILEIYFAEKQLQKPVHNYSSVPITVFQVHAPLIINTLPLLIEFHTFLPAKHSCVAYKNTLIPQITLKFNENKKKLLKTRIVSYMPLLIKSKSELEKKN